ncbi:MAG: hypothetical protein DMG54_04070 [Acidobacteria bacterium]|nr:MAG: hypothetical protein DMG54_04070 [Acidobacteriota bacterium]PYU77441.1 MAG: hypothetical protein DMG52_00290 [Acidobacteriota bacterium]
MIAAWYCREDTVALLLAHGANVNTVDNDGYSPLMHSVQNCEDGRVPALLLRLGAKIGTTAKNGDTALFIASIHGNEQVVHVLVAAGADIAAKTEGETALTIARDLDVGRKASDGEALILTENVFRIRQVVLSTEKDPVKLQIDGRVYSLEPGEVLLLLG